MQRCAILMYHIFDTPRSAEEAPLCCEPESFARQMHYISESEHTPISLSKLLECMNGQSEWSANAVAVTIDDGYACAYQNALPILTHYGIPASVFVVASRVGSYSDWDDGFPRRSILSRSELIRLSIAGIDIGSHSCSHPRLAEVDTENLFREIHASKAILEDVLGKAVLNFAYPYGNFNNNVRDVVEAAGYSTACSTISGFNFNLPNTDRFALRRIEVFGNDSPWTFRQKLRFGINELPHLSLVRKVRRRLKGIFPALA